MKLQEVFEQLSYGEFSQLSIGGAEQGVINESNYTQVLSHINLGLTALYTRFNLKERRVTFPLNTAADTYQLNIDDILKIEQILTDADVELSINKPDDPYSIAMPSLQSVRVPQVILDQGPDLPDAAVTESLTVVYRANHPRLVGTLGMSETVSTVLELPYSHLTALLYFVASRVNNPIGMTNEFHAGNSWFAKYEGECQRLELTNLQVDKTTYNDHLTRNGWV